MKKVILILIDSLMPDILEGAVFSRKTPALEFLMQNGMYNNKCVTAFPTMTANIDATLLTGVYPEKHKIPGLIWYDSKEKRLIDYINGPKTVFKLGINNTLKDALVNMNEKHLNKGINTIYEDLNKCNQTAASINFIVHRGKSTHKLKPSVLLNMVTKYSLKNSKITGPELLYMGSMCKSNISGKKISWGINQTLFKRYGINDTFALEVAKKIIRSNRQPAFMAIYLPEFDHYLHKNIDKPYKKLISVDQKLAKLLDAFGSWEEAVSMNTFIILGDHGQTKVGIENSHEIDLDLLLNDYKILKIGNKTNEYDEVVLANNERMTYIYPLKKEIFKSIKKELLSDERIDFISSKEEEKVIVENHLGKKIVFKKNGNYIDPHGIKWNIYGDLNLLDIKIDVNNRIKYNLYPDALARLYGAMFSHDDSFYIVTAKPSYEFKSKTFPLHLGGGSHGSLHRVDSIVPLLVVGETNKPVSNIRIVDLKDYILKILKE